MPSINSAIDTANKVLMQYWPLNAFIATNPLWDLRNKPFFDVVSDPNFQSLMDINFYYEKYQEGHILDQDIYQAIKLVENKNLDDGDLHSWIEKSREEKLKIVPDILFSHQIDEYQFQKSDLWIKERIFSLLRDYFGLVPHKKIPLIDFWYRQNNFKNIEIINLQSISVKESIAFLLNALNISEALTATYLETIYLQVYGWASFMKWRNHHPTNPWISGEDACELILLFWLTYEYIISLKTHKTYLNKCPKKLEGDCINALKQRYVWQTAFELHYMNKLDLKLNNDCASNEAGYDAQFIFCIDTRSEGFRRHLEGQGNFQTFGSAGFFGVIFNLCDDEKIYYQAPALVKADHLMTAKRTKSRFEILLNKFNKIITEAKRQLAAPFAFFEMVGFWYFPFMIFKTIQRKLKRKNQANNLKISNNFSIEEQFHSAYSLLKSIGLVHNFSRYIMICAHQTDNINNPFQASLNCGACGGNSGVPNALVMCDILNNPNVRLKLQDVKISIPKETQFIPASHHTTNDHLEVIGGEIPAAIKKSIDQAAKKLRQEKSSTLPGHSSLFEREKNWSELIPELGLINNACIIIGPRTLTLNQNLERRAFLQSYDPELDHDGSILTTILSAPAVVAHWISSQYYFSTVNPHIFGAGNKAIHNVLPGIGVLEGNLSDLKVGLPLQSTHFQSKPIHEPRRIIVVVNAKKQILDKAIENAPDFKMLLNNEWIYLKHIERC